MVINAVKLRDYYGKGGGVHGKSFFFFSKALKFRMCTAIEYCRLSTVLASCLAVEVQILMFAGTLKEISHVFCFQKVKIISFKGRNTH